MDLKDRIVKRLNETKMGRTSMDNDHAHDYEINHLGDGYTTSTIPEEFHRPHCHCVTNYEVDPVRHDGHKHSL